jgi:hypothetical protein
MSFFAFPMYANIDMISARPILLVPGKKAHSRYYSEDVYKMAAEPRELLIVPGADHVDLHDRVDTIPFDKLAASLQTHLRQAYVTETAAALGNRSKWKYHVRGVEAVRPPAGVAAF